MKTRRQHLREMTFREIKQIARDLLVTEGLHAVTINAVARRMGMSGPAIYRYFASHDDLIAGLTAEHYRELIMVVEAARIPGKVNLLPMARALRQWALQNRAGFRLIFGSPPVPLEQEQEEREDRQAANAFGEVFFSEVEAIWKVKRFALPDLSTMESKLKDQLKIYANQMGDRLPPEAIYVFLNCWIRLYGLLCIEVLGHINFAITDAEPLFEDCLKELSDWLGIDYKAIVT